HPHFERLDLGRLWVSIQWATPFRPTFMWPGRAGCGFGQELQKLGSTQDTKGTKKGQRQKANCGLAQRTTREHREVSAILCHSLRATAVLRELRVLGGLQRCGWPRPLGRHECRLYTQ